MKIRRPSAMVSALLASLTMLAAVPAAQASQDEAIKLYRSSCMVCHASGMANAPRLGDKARWTPLKEQGEEALMDVVVKGKGAMPPRGGAAKASDEQLRGVVRYMLEQAG